VLNPAGASGATAILRRAMAHSSPGRWLAPLALPAASLPLVVVVATGLGSSSSSDPTTPDVPVSTATQTTRARTTKTTTTTTTTHAPTTAGATYTVQAGDFLSTVAAKTGVSVERLRALNPGLNANAMHVGQQIRLR